MDTKQRCYVIVYPNDPMCKGTDHYYQRGLLRHKKGIPYFCPKLVSELDEATIWNSKQDAKDALEDCIVAKGYAKPSIVPATISFHVELLGKGQ
jgi:hypothetical protein